MKITPDWSGCFAELRNGHFHSGLDFRTGEVEGQAIYAVADGILINVTVSPTGYGRSIDIRHKNGIITRYGHLSAFIPKIEDEVLDNQYYTKSFRVDFKPKSVTNVKQGDLIGYSGNSGSSGGPHLHFEMRSENNIVFNPCLYGFILNDSLAPVISQLAVYQVTNDECLYDSEIRNLYNVVKKTHYSIKDTVKITLNKVFFGIESVDKIQGNRFEFGLYSLKMFIDDNMVFYWQLDTIYNWYARDINAFIDYFLYDSIGTKIQWTKKMPGNRLNFYRQCDNNGIFDFEENKTYKIRFEASDFNKNCSVLEFFLEKINQIEEIKKIKKVFKGHF
jgi:hypothetical protein